MASLLPESTCFTGPADWVLFVTTLWTLWTSWWIPEFVEVAVYRRNGLPFRKRLSIAGAAVKWNATRILSPGFTAIMSMSRASSPEEWPALYYFGYEPDYAGGSIPGITIWQWAKILLMDLPSLVLQPLLLAWAAHLYKLEEEEDTRVPILPSRWVMGSVPAAYTGLCLLLMSATPFLRPRVVFHAFWCVMAVLALVGIAFLLTIYFATNEGQSLGWASVVPLAWVWALLMFPVHVSLCCGAFGPMVLYIVLAALRAVPLGVDMLTAREDFPFCGANHVAVVAIFALFAVFIMWHAAYNGWASVEKFCRAEYNKMRQASSARRKNRRDEEAVSLQSREGLVQGDRDGVL